MGSHSKEERTNKVQGLTLASILLPGRKPRIYQSSSSSQHKDEQGGGEAANSFLTFRLVKKKRIKSSRQHFSAFDSRRPQKQ